MNNHIKGDESPEHKKSDTQKKPYTLPSWRVNQIIVIAIRFLNEVGYWKEGFDYQKVICDMDIVIKAYSAFKSENLAELHKLSLRRSMPCCHGQRDTERMPHDCLQ